MLDSEQVDCRTHVAVVEALVGVRPKMPVQVRGAGELGRAESAALGLGQRGHIAGVVLGRGLSRRRDDLRRAGHGSGRHCRRLVVFVFRCGVVNGRPEEDGMTD